MLAALHKRLSVTTIAPAIRIPNGVTTKIKSIN
jgi:hypothetical protein